MPSVGWAGHTLAPFKLSVDKVGARQACRLQAMLGSIKRWFSGGNKPVEFTSMEQWAGTRGLTLRRVRDGEGCVFEGKLGTQEWRGEWGESQRGYLGSHEFRLIAELGLPKDLLVLLLNRKLMESLEKAVFEQFVEGVQTRIDTETPPEMRWLVMFPKLTGQELSGLRERFGGVSSIKPWMVQWLEGPLTKAITAMLPKMGEDDPVVMTIGKGRLTLRTAMLEPDPDQIAAWQKVFECAMREARRAMTEWQGSSTAGHSTQPSSWSHSSLPREDPPPKA